VGPGTGLDDVGKKSRSYQDPNSDPSAVQPVASPLSGSFVRNEYNPLRETHSLQQALAFSKFHTHLSCPARRCSHNSFSAAHDIRRFLRNGRFTAVLTRHWTLF
jgi:hypothetical protein